MLQPEVYLGLTTGMPTGRARPLYRKGLWRHLVKRARCYSRTLVGPPWKLYYVFVVYVISATGLRVFRGFQFGFCRDTEKGSHWTWAETEAPVPRERERARLQSRAQPVKFKDGREDLSSETVRHAPNHHHHPGRERRGGEPTQRAGPLAFPHGNAARKATSRLYGCPCTWWRHAALEPLDAAAREMLRPLWRRRREAKWLEVGSGDPAALCRSSSRYPRHPPSVKGFI